MCHGWRPGTVAVFTNPDDEFSVLLKGVPEDAMMRSLLGTNEIYGLEMLATAPAVIPLSGQLRGQRMVLCIDKNAAAGVLIKASSRAPVVLALIEGFRGCVAQLSAPCWAERASSEANSGDARSRNRPLFAKADGATAAQPGGRPQQ